MGREGKTVAVSGGFDPLHRGHVRMIEQAALYGEKLIVFLNNDDWLMNKKGYVFMPFQDRAEILYALGTVTLVIPAGDEDGSVCSSLRKFKPDVFCNGGDRFEDNVPEKAVCEELGIEMVFNVGGKKIQSSSELVDKCQKIRAAS